MEIIDISRPIAAGVAMPPGVDAPGTELISEISDGSPSRVSRLTNWTTHLLTHIDAPSHFVVGGASVDQLALSRFTGPASVVAVAGAYVRSDDVPDVPPGHNILFRTANSGRPTDVFHRDHVYIGADAIDALLDRRPNLVAIDYFGVDRYDDPACPAHKRLLAANVLILESVDLSDVEPGRYTLWALPLRITHGDGSPVRAVLTR